MDLASLCSYAIVRYVEDVEAKVFHCLLLDDGGWMTDDKEAGNWMQRDAPFESLRVRN